MFFVTLAASAGLLDFTTGSDFVRITSSVGLVLLLVAKFSDLDVRNFGSSKS